MRQRRILGLAAKVLAVADDFQTCLVSLIHRAWTDALGRSVSWTRLRRLTSFPFPPINPGNSVNPGGNGCDMRHYRQRDFAGKSKSLPLTRVKTKWGRSSVG